MTTTHIALPKETIVAEKSTPTKAPQDRKPSKADQNRDAKRKREAVAEFMSTGIDFSPFTIDAGDGREWSFSPDPMPAQTERLRKAMNELNEAGAQGENLVQIYDELTEAIRDRLLNEKDKKEFPLPQYGINALSFFAIHLATGRDGFPTEEV